MLAGLLGIACALRGLPARAQQPICPPLAPGEAVLTSCRPLSSAPAIRLLADFTVDHLLKPAPPAFGRGALELAQPFVGKELRDNPDLTAFLNALPSVRFTQLDRGTGTLAADFSGARREFQSPMQGVSGEPTLAIRFPEHLEGGYWRAPDALQVAFWEGKRIDARLVAADGTTREVTLQCLALGPDGLLLRMGPDGSPPIFLAFRDCIP